MVSQLQSTFLNLGNKMNISDFDNLALRIFPHKDLTTPCEPVTTDEFGTFDLEVLCGKMISIMKAFEGVGLAANQVGIHKRIFVFENAADDGIKRDMAIPSVFINPEIIDTDETTSKLFKEGCLSFPGSYPHIERKQNFKMRYYDQNGEEFILGPDVCCGLLGHAFQHEIDHLDGITMLDKCNFIDKQKIRKKVNKLRGRK